MPLSIGCPSVWGSPTQWQTTVSVHTCAHTNIHIVYAAGNECRAYDVIISSKFFETIQVGSSCDGSPLSPLAPPSSANFSTYCLAEEAENERFSFDDNP